MKKGCVIFLNGPSSGGKTTLSRRLQKEFPVPLYYTSYDLTRGEMIPYLDRYQREGGRFDAEEEFLTVMAAMARGAASVGRSIVVDNCYFDTQTIYESTRALLSDVPTLLIRVRCPVEELRRREKARGNRAIGKAEWQEAHIKPASDGDYDLVVDTFAEPTEISVDRIVALWQTRMAAQPEDDAL